MSNYILYDYWRSSAAYRVRIALHVKGLKHEHRPVNLKEGKQKDLEYLKLNPQGAVPMLVEGNKTLTQSLAIIEYLEDTHPSPALLPKDPAEKALVRAMAQIVACDIHPLNNLKVLKHLSDVYNVSENAKEEWYRRWVYEGFSALETLVTQHGSSGRFCFGDTPSLADICLIPQMYNARRFSCKVEDFPTLVDIDIHCNSLEAFHAARPEAQQDALPQL